MTQDRRNLAALAAITLIAALSLWLRSGFPLYAIGSGNADEFLFIRLAAALRRAHWLGAYDHFIMVKGIFYPAFIAVTSLLHIPLKVAEHLVYLAVAGGFSFLCYRLAHNRALAVIVFGALALNPALWTHSLARVIRDGLYISLALGVIVTLAALWSEDCSRKVRIALALLAGGFAAAFWLTREEGIWLIPAILVLAAFTSLALYMDGRPRAEKRVAARKAGIATGLAGITAAAIVAVVALINFALYGVFTDVEFRAPGFLSAYGALSRVKHEHWQRHVVVPRDVREKVYAVSEAAATLRPGLEGKIGEQWIKAGCAAQPIKPCADILGGWFIWALRDAAAFAGHHSSGGDAETFYARMAREIDNACDAGKLDCFAQRAALQPPFRAEYVGDVVRMAPRMVSLLFTFGAGEVVAMPSTGSAQRLAFFREYAGDVEFPPREAAIESLAGWIAGPTAAPTVALVDAEGRGHGVVEPDDAPDIDRALGDRGLHGRRFFIRPQCPALDCTLQFTFADGAVRTVPLAAVNGELPTDPAYVLSIDHVAHESVEMPAETRARLASRQQVASLVLRAITASSPVLFITGVLGLLVAFWKFRRDAQLVFLTGVGAAALAAVATRVVLLSYLEVTTFPALNILYLSSATPFVLIVIALGNGLGVLTATRATSA